MAPSSCERATTYSKDVPMARAGRRAWLPSGVDTGLVAHKKVLNACCPGFKKQGNAELKGLDVDSLAFERIQVSKHPRCATVLTELLVRFTQT